MPQEYPSHWTPLVESLFHNIALIEAIVRTECAVTGCAGRRREDQPSTLIAGLPFVLCQEHYEELHEAPWSSLQMPAGPPDGTPPAATWKQVALLTEHLMRICRSCGAHAEDGEWVVRVWDARMESELTYCPNCKESAIRRLRRLRDERAAQADREFTATMVESLVFGDAVGIVVQGPPKEDQS